MTMTTATYIRTTGTW